MMKDRWIHNLPGSPKLSMPIECGTGVQISGQTFGELRIVPDMHTRKVRSS